MPMIYFPKILVANHGELAIRIARKTNEIGIDIHAEHGAILTALRGTSGIRPTHESRE